MADQESPQGSPHDASGYDFHALLGELRVIRASGETNMLDREGVYAVAQDRGFQSVMLWLDEIHHDRFTAGQRYMAGLRAMGDEPDSSPAPPLVGTPLGGSAMISDEAPETTSRSQKRVSTVSLDSVTTSDDSATFDDSDDSADVAES